MTPDSALAKVPFLIPEFLLIGLGSVRSTLSTIVQHLPVKQVRRRWGPSDVRQRVTLRQAAEKAAENASQGKQRKPTTSGSEHESSDSVEDVVDEDNEIDEDEEDALVAFMEQPYLYHL